MKRILFVDDEENVLAALRGVLRKQRNIWEMKFACGGEAALGELLCGHYDVIVSDMRMPGIDGAALLRKVMEDYPHVVRIVLSGQTEQDVSRRMVHVAHQFISKPCDSVTLVEVIERACKLQSLLEQEGLRQAVGQIGQLPVKPRIYSELVHVMADPMSSAADAASIIEKDIAASAKVLQVVNSAFFGLPQRVTSVSAAVSYLGFELIKALILSVEMRESLGKIPTFPGFSLEAINDHALFTGRIARRLLPEKVASQDAFAASMLQDVGLLVLASKMSERFGKVLAAARGGERSLEEAETEVLGVTHAEVGAYLLGIWGLPYPVVEAVAFHHQPRRSSATTLDVVSGVHVASALAHELHVGHADGLACGPTLDVEWLRGLGLGDRIPTWRNLAMYEAKTVERQG